jgi:hypothetical protein
MALAASQVPRWDRAQPQELASACQALEEQECPAAAYQGTGYQTSRLYQLLGAWWRNIGHVVGIRLPVIRWSAVFWNRIKLWELR